MKTRLVFLCLVFLSSSIIAGERFNPPDCEYSVVFPDPPKKYNLQKATADGARVPMYGAELTVSKGRAFIRAECVSSGLNDLSQFTEKNMISYMEQLALDNGLSRSGFKVDSNSLGNIGELTGVKDSKRGRMTVRITNYIGARSIMTIYIAALSKDFQTEEMRTFSNTIDRR